MDASDGNRCKRCQDLTVPAGGPLGIDPTSGKCIKCVLGTEKDMSLTVPRYTGVKNLKY